eukprot:12159875-Karenia_brevis.AAC.1
MTQSTDVGNIDGSTSTESRAATANGEASKVIDRLTKLHSIRADQKLDNISEESVNVVSTSTESRA